MEVRSYRPAAFDLRSRCRALPEAARARNISSGRLFAALCRSPQDLFRGRQLLGLARWCDDKSSGNGQAQAPEVKRWFLPLFEISLRVKARVSPAPPLCGTSREGFLLAQAVDASLVQHQCNPFQPGEAIKAAVVKI